MELDGEHGHVHLLVNYPPKVAVSNLVNIGWGLPRIWSRVVDASAHLHSTQLTQAAQLLVCCAMQVGGYLMFGLQVVVGEYIQIRL